LTVFYVMEEEGEGEIFGQGWKGSPGSGPMARQELEGGGSNKPGIIERKQEKGAHETEFHSNKGSHSWRELEKIRRGRVRVVEKLNTRAYLRESWGRSVIKREINERFRSTGNQER